MFSHCYYSNSHNLDKKSYPSEILRSMNCELLLQHQIQLIQQTKKTKKINLEENFSKK